MAFLPKVLFYFVTIQNYVKLLAVSYLLQCSNYICQCLDLRIICCPACAKTNN